MSYTLSRSCEKHQLCLKCYTFYTEFHDDSNHIKVFLNYSNTVYGTLGDAKLRPQAPL